MANLRQLKLWAILQALANRQSDQTEVTPEQSALAVFAKYPAGTVHVYLDSNAYSDTQGTTLAQPGDTVQLIKDSQSTSNAIESGNAPVKASDGSIGFNFSNTQFLSTGPLWGAADDSFNCVVAASADNTSASGEFISSVSVQSDMYEPYGAIAMVPNAAINAVWAGNGNTLNATVGDNTVMRVITAIRRGANAYLRVGGVQQSTKTLTNVPSDAPNAGVIGRLCLIDGNGFTGKIAALVAIKGTVTDADAAIIEAWMQTFA